MIRFARRLAALALAAFVAPLQAFTPESGFWWNPAEPGRGINLEIQDNFLALTAYVYSPGGQTTWFTSQGLMQGNARYSGVLDGFAGGQCIGCPFRLPSVSPGAGGTISIVFTSERTATLTWGGQTLPIERFDFYLTRTAGDLRTEMMLGEWQVVIDLFDRGGEYSDYPFYGDVIVLDRLDRSDNPDYFEGCRPIDSLAGECTGEDRDLHDAAGFYDAGTGEHVIVVKDVPGAPGADAVYFAYFVTTGTSQFDGVMEIYEEDETVGNGPFYPVRGFRSASRSFVETGSGPSAAEAKAGRAVTGGLTAMLRAEAPRGLDAAAVRARYGIDVDALAPGAERLIRQRLANAPR